MNPTQLLAATHHEGPAVVYAGAGSGKTRVICSRMAWLIQDQNVPASSILAVTFTNKAAKEMKHRVEDLIGPARAKNLIVSTFHAFCAKFLRIYAQEAGFSSQFSIYDDDDQKSLLKDILKQLNVPDKLLSVATVKSKIDRIKNQGLSPEDYARQLRMDSEISKQEKMFSVRGFGEHQYNPDLIQKVYEYYQKRLKQQNAMDFNDLLLVMYSVLKEKPHVLASLQNRFRYFLIDEFQDTNPIQFKLIQILSSHTKNLFIVGDDDQSIYSWRGADPSFILNFNKMFEGAKTFKLEQNYRSTKNIVHAASKMIQNNKKRADKVIFTEADPGTKIKIKPNEDPHQEAHFIANQIYHEVKKEDRKFSDFCILYRTNAQSRSLEDELRRRMIPYVIYGSVRFYERAEIKILLSYLKLLLNTSDDACFQKIVNTPRRGFGDTAMQKLKEVAQANSESLLKSAADIVFGSRENSVARSLSGLKTFVMQFQKWKTHLELGHKPSQILAEIISDIGFKEYLNATYPEDFDDRWLNVVELKNAVIEFEQGEHEEAHILTKFIEQAMLTVEPTVFNVAQGQSNAVTLMTVHSAKGLEFSDVFIAGLEEGVLPHQNSIDSMDAVEEERRLMYVAMTRARKDLTLTYCKRNRYKEFLPAQESRFISEIPFEYVEYLENTKKEFIKRDFQKPNPSAHTPSASSPEKDSSSWRKGQRVAHKIFGEGTVCGIEPSHAGVKLRIHFHGAGEKTLIHTFVTPI